MIEWVMENQQLITLLISASTLLVWVFYAQLLLLNFRRQRKPSLIINRGAGRGLGSLCLISNMSADPMFISQLVVCRDLPRAVAGGCHRHPPEHGGGRLPRPCDPSNDSPGAVAQR